MLVALLTALAALLRLLWLSDIPPGLYHDEGYNGLDALRVLSGEWPVYFPANNGREPALIYIIAVTVGLVGRTPGALRLAAAACGTFTIPATYVMARTWFSRRVALLGTAVLAVTFWHVHLSRIGFRAITLPLAMALALWTGARAYRSGRVRDWLLCGVLYGVCFYTYLPARFSLIALLACGFLLAVAGRGRRLWPGVVWFVAGAALAIAPLAVYAIGNWDQVMGRAGQVSVFNPAINGGDLWGTLARQLVRTLGMFFVRGDTIARHNLPGRPVFDPVLGAAMVIGAVQIVRNRRRSLAPALTGVWVAVMVIPTWVAEDAPHFLRAVGVLPLLPFLPAVGLDAAIGWLERRSLAKWGKVLVCGVLLLGLGLTIRDYFLVYAKGVDVAYAFEDAATALAAEANRFIGSGWDGDGLSESNGELPERTVFIDSRLCEEWAAIPFLVPQSEAVVVASEQAASSMGTDRQGGVLLLAWPYGEVERFLAALPLDSVIEAHRGPLARGDLEEEASTAYVAYAALPGTADPSGRLAYFGDSIALVGYEIDADSDDWQVTLRWEALASLGESYTVFVHLLGSDRILAQHDGLPAGGLYTTAQWRPGDVIVDRHLLDTRGEILDDEPGLVVGLYIWPTMDRLPANLPSGELLGHEFTLR